MSAIANVGELASPYYLLEVWSRREDIDIDPETYASLKQKARKLVRDYRRFDARDEKPDDDWWEARLELLGLSGSRWLEVGLADGAVEVLVWQDGLGRDAVVVGDLRDDTDPDEREAGSEDPAATRFEMALDAYDGAAGWGLLLAGPKVRVYRRSSGISQQYLQLDLEQLVELDDEPTWRAFAAIFRAPAFAADEGTVPLIRRVVEESRRHASALAADMRADVVEAAEVLLNGAFSNPANTDRLAKSSQPKLQSLFEESLYLLYRVLFVLYAESRDVLAIRGAGPYATTYSVDHLVELARSSSALGPGTYIADTLARLFGLLWEDPHGLASRLGIEPVGGELFDPARTAVLNECVIDDNSWGRALRSIAVGSEASARARFGRRSSFTELGVDQLGSIYEGLLTLEPHLVTGDEVLVRRDKDGERRVLPAEVDLETLGGYRVVRPLADGELVLESSSGRRKGSGSFYTPHEITEYLTTAALGPLVEPLVERAKSDPSGAEAALLALRVCDPAMGSGAFLVQAARVLGRALARIRSASGRRRVTPELVKHCERLVVRDCLYGVDLNPLAVALAKVSLWLETLEPSRPLSFLDAHLRCGDSLIGAPLVVDGRLDARGLASWCPEAGDGLMAYLKAEAGAPGAELLGRLKRKTKRRSPTQASLPGIGVDAVEVSLVELAAARAKLVESTGEVETLDEVIAVQQGFEAIEAEESSLRNRLVAAADLWCSQWFSAGEDAPSDEDGTPVGLARFDEFHSLLGCLLEGRSVPDHLGPLLLACRGVAERRRFFHWALELPEVLFTHGGFDAVIGNPPWNTLSPSDDEFFSTYDPLGFARSVPKVAKELRKAELREDAEVDSSWREQARFLYELSHWAKPESGQFSWYAPDGQLRKGDANVFRLFVERAYKLLRPGGRLAQVLPDSFYVSSPATGLRQHLLGEARLERCYVFENRRKLFPIDSRLKVVLLVAEAGSGPTTAFPAAFLTGKDAIGRERAVSLDELADVLSRLEESSPMLSVQQIRALAPETWSFPELQTALDAEIATQCAKSVPALNLDDQGWGLTYCRELDADRDSWRFRDAAQLEERGATRSGLRWRDPEGYIWWPLVEGANFYHLEFPARSRKPSKWVRGDEVAAIGARKNLDGSSVMDHYRVAWRDVARSVDERSAIAAVLPPRTAAKDTSLTVRGGTLTSALAVTLASLISSFCFDYLVRFAGKTHLKYAAINTINGPHPGTLSRIVPLAAEVVCRNEEFDALWRELRPGEARPDLDDRAIAGRRARIDAEVALAYGLSLRQFAAVLSTFPNIDRSQPMLPGEPKCFFTRDLALLAYCEATRTEPADIAKVLAGAGVELPEPSPGLRRLDQRVKAYDMLGALAYRPTPRGGRTPSDPALLEAVRELLSEDALSPAEIAESLDEDATVIAKVLKVLVKSGAAFRENRGKSTRYYAVEESS